ncbi:MULTISPECIES: dihydropteroate synthase [Ruminococcus]|uniref:Dihydropteroate synthase n=1 Tax=Ruminococcus albus (strain ATCC 27210 / DSM 20455 / JCM 14654 / NCDO 2250 / 7) TaxID=697329 RepID=E6UAJ5_RUMA7|nr:MULTISPECIES: dihydropteroate synthase [Ruminococcus]ADU22417.1 dihydropteroate synthase [Ruminococcus albus 7 = DSM 20455]MCR5019943.1 dihydropteroate synthase [Ruminococcus sp.]
MKIGNREFDTENECYIMGILNVTPDSFSDGGKFNNIDSALSHAEAMISEGVDIIDVGGESTRPGFTRISDDEEISRIVPVIEALKERFDVPVSIDTYKYKVASAAAEAGADLFNDIYGLKYDNGEMAAFIAKSGLPCCLMHNRNNMDYVCFMDDLINDMRETVDIAKKAGITDDSIILDPGVGFAKSLENNLEAIDRLDMLKNELGYPVLLGTSRKSVIGLTLDLPSDQRVEGTIATTVIGVMRGAAFVRVHDVKENLRAVKMTQAIMRGYKRG